jgi:hypothetical protein
MSNNNVTYVINVSGNATANINKITGATSSATQSMGKLCTLFQKFTFASVAVQSVSKAFSLVKNSIAGLEQAYQMQNVAETKLQQVLRNTTGATDEQIQGIKDLAAAQQKLGVIGDEVQLAGAQELSTYVSKTESIKKLLPAMNDMLAQQYGINASQEQAANIATMMGKVLDGQTGALSRYGYKFSDAEEHILKYGKEAARVRVLAKIINESVGGVNEALAQTPEGKMKQIANDMGDTKERFGKFITVTKNAFYPVFQTILEKINKIGDWFERNQERISGVVTKVANAISTAINKVGAAILWVRDFTVNAFGYIKSVIEKVGNFFVWLCEKIKSLYPIIIAVVTVVGLWILKTNLLAAAKYRLWWQVALLKRDINTLKNNIIKTTAAIWGKITAVWSAIYAEGTWMGLTFGLAIAMKVLQKAIYGVSAAIYSIPIIGWIAAGIALIIGIFKLLWEKCEGFRRVVFGVWEVVKMVFVYIWEFIKTVFGFLLDLVKKYIQFWINVYTTIWEFLKKLGQGIADFFVGILDYIVSFFQMVFDPVKRFFAWLFEMFPKIGAFIKKAFQPLLDFFSNLWETVKNIFSWILDKMTVIFNPIIQLWNKLTGKVVETYKTGDEKGSESWRKSQKEKEMGTDGISDPSLSGTSTLDDKKKTAPNSVTKGAEATATGGTRNTSITIHMGKFFDNIVFNGGLAENAKEVERKMEEIMLRVLYAAQNAG